MNVSDKIAELNYNRFKNWKNPMNSNSSKQAIYAFKGDVYTGFECEDWKAADFDFAQKKLRILSGLYGVLRPLDLIQAYRLEMGTSLSTARGKNLYAFWGVKITLAVNESLRQTRSKFLINLASNEYFTAVRPELLSAEVITPAFKDFKNGKYKFISFYAKKARGMMANYIVSNRIKSPEKILNFSAGGYYFDQESSTPEAPVFLRD